MNPHDIAQLLPYVFQRTLHPGTPLSALLEVMAAMHQPAESVLQHLDAYVDPRRTPDECVPYLASWLGLDRLYDASAKVSSQPELPISTGLPALRELTAIAIHLYQWRGTREGLVLFLETATRTRGFEVSEQNLNANRELIPFHIRVIAPHRTQPHRPLIERIIESEKPAYVTYDLHFTAPLAGDDE